ncbi:hypothetical protein BJ742DRAFT_769824 [Cladochytrium replicatum]|nr:hypothetical protein BJ742DRAFT_769824 [Cladochytrium replicatum]
MRNLFTYLIAATAALSSLAAAVVLPTPIAQSVASPSEYIANVGNGLRLIQTSETELKWMTDERILTELIEKKLKFMDMTFSTIKDKFASSDGARPIVKHLLSRCAEEWLEYEYKCSHACSDHANWYVLATQQRTLARPSTTAVYPGETIDDGNPYIHTASDSLSRVNYTYMAEHSELSSSSCQTQSISF